MGRTKVFQKIVPVLTINGSQEGILFPQKLQQMSGNILVVTSEDNGFATAI